MDDVANARRLFRDQTALSPSRHAAAEGGIAGREVWCAVIEFVVTRLPCCSAATATARCLEYRHRMTLVLQGARC